MKLFIICGHGEGDPGADGGGYTEAERVRALAAKIKELGGEAVILGDTSKNWYRDKLISTYNFSEDSNILELHMDAGGGSARGGHIIIKEGFAPDEYDLSLALSISILMPGRAENIKYRSDLANVNRAAKRGLNYRLMECGFIDNDQDRKIFNDHIAEIAEGILRDFGIIVTKKTTGKWIKDKVGDWWQDPDGSYPRNCWRKIAGTFYWFNEKGYVVQNQWIQYQGNFYWLNGTGGMRTGWNKIDGEWYFLNDGVVAPKKPVGAMLTGWVLAGGNYFYLRPKREGKHAQGTLLEGELKGYAGNDYYLVKSGEDRRYQTGQMLTGWRQAGDDYYWYNTIATKDMPLGAMYKNKWLKLPEAWYYFKDNGEMACDETLVIGGKKYMFGKNGYMQQNE